MVSQGKKRLPPVALLAILVLLAVLAVCVVRWYYEPLVRSAEMEVFDQAGNTATVSLEISLRRSFFHPADVEGTLCFQGETYRHLGSKDYGFWDGLRQKLEGGMLTKVFANTADFYGQGDVLSDLLYIQGLALGRDYALEEISFIHDGVWWFSAGLLPAT